MNVLVTGGAGYVGTMLVPMLLDQGHRVAVFDSLLYDIGPILPFFRRDGFSFARGDIRDRPSLESFARQADAIVHLAAVVGSPACAQAPQEAQSTNVDGTRNVAAVAGRSRPVVFASTGSCYGAVSDALCAEETPLRPLSLYGTSKVQAERVMLEECSAVVYRLATAYGLSPRLRLDLLVNDFVHRALHERRLSVYEGHARRSFIHVWDVARAVIFALDRPAAMTGRTFNVGDESQNRTKLEICQLIQRLIPDVRIEAGAPGTDVDHRDYAVSYAGIRALGFSTQVALEDGVRELCAALRWIDRREAFTNLARKAGRERS